MRQVKSIVSLLGLATLGGFGGAAIYKQVYQEPISISAKQDLQSKAAVHYTAYAPEALTDFSAAADLSVHAVVHVKTEYASSTAMDPFQEFLFGRNGAPQIQQAAGSGVIISDDGYITTNNHVVEGANKIEIVLNDRRKYKARIVGTDPATDLALLKIEEKGLPFIRYGNSDVLKVGQWVLAVGNPFNLTSTVTAGIVSAKARSLGMGDPANNHFAIESFIQTDAAVNRGNSGGALVNTQGELVGINSAIASSTGVYAGYSFAIPVNIVKKVMDDLVQFGQVQRALIGVSISDIDAGIAEARGLKEIKGVLVNGVSANSAAQEAGLNQGDVILKIGEVAVNSPAELQEQIGRFRPGDKVMVTMVRNGREKVIPVLLKNAKGTTSLEKHSENASSNMLGATFENVNSNELQKLGIDGGVKISKITDGKLRSTGIREGFIITAIDNKEIRTTEDLNRALSNKKGGVLIEGLYSNGLHAYYAFGM